LQFERYHSDCLVSSDGSHLVFNVIFLRCSSVSKLSKFLYFVLIRYNMTS